MNKQLCTIILKIVVSYLFDFAKYFHVGYFKKGSLFYENGSFFTKKGVCYMKTGLGVCFMKMGVWVLKIRVFFTKTVVLFLKVGVCFIKLGVCFTKMGVWVLKMGVCFFENIFLLRDYRQCDLPNSACLRRCLHSQAPLPEICTKMFKEMNEKLRAKFPATTPSCSMVKIGRLDDSFFGH